MSTPASNVNPTTEALETKRRKELEKIKSSNWNLIHGDLEKFLVGDEAEECVVFEKNLPLEIAGSSNAASVQTTNTGPTKTVPMNTASAGQAAPGSVKDKKAGQESHQLQVVQIILQRVEGNTLDLNSLNAGHRLISNGKKAFTVYFCLGTGKRRTEKAPYFLLNSYQFSNADYKLFESEMEHTLFSVFRHDMPLSHSDYNRVRVANDKLREQGRLESTLVTGLMTGNMRDYMVEQMFLSLQKLRFLTEEDVQFLKAIVQHREPGPEEVQLNKQKEFALSKGDIKSALETVEALHALSRQEALARGSNRTTEREGIRKLCLIDDSDAAFKLGELLEKISPADAIKAFNIVAEYEHNRHAYDEIYESPFTEEALGKIADLRMALLGSAKDENTARKMRRDAIKAAFLNLASDDPEVQKDVFTTVLKLVETQAGFDNFGDSNRLFDKIKFNTQDPMGGIEVLLDMIIAMADKLYDYRKNEPKSSNASHDLNDNGKTGSADVKASLEKEAIKAKANAGHTTGSNAVSNAAVTSSSNKPAALTYLRDASAAAKSNVKSLDEDDDADDAYELDLDADEIARKLASATLSNSKK